MGAVLTPSLAKTFTTGFYPMGKELEGILMDWVNELKGDYLFAISDPLFPKTKVGLGPTHKFEALGIAREPWASASSAAKNLQTGFLRREPPTVLSASRARHDRRIGKGSLSDARRLQSLVAKTWGTKTCLLRSGPTGRSRPGRPNGVDGAFSGRGGPSR